MFIKISFYHLQCWRTFLIMFIKVENCIKGLSNVKLSLHSWEKSILFVLSFIYQFCKNSICKQQRMRLSCGFSYSYSVSLDIKVLLTSLNDSFCKQQSFHYLPAMVVDMRCTKFSNTCPLLSRILKQKKRLMVQLCTQCCGHTEKAGFVTLGGREKFVCFLKVNLFILIGG